MQQLPLLNLPELAVEVWDGRSSCVVWESFMLMIFGPRQELMTSLVQAQVMNDIFQMFLAQMKGVPAQPWLMRSAPQELTNDSHGFHCPQVTVLLDSQAAHSWVLQAACLLHRCTYYRPLLTQAHYSSKVEGPRTVPLFPKPIRLKCTNLNCSGHDMAMSHDMVSRACCSLCCVHWSSQVR